MASPYLHALSCSKCGAALSAQPGQQLLTCQYCGQAHVLGAATAARATPRRSATPLLLLAVAFFVLVLGASALLSGRAPGSAVAQGTGPGDPRTRYQVAQQVEIHYGATWYPGRILQLKQDSYEISYDGWSSHWNEWVDATRLRARQSPASEVPTVPIATAQAAYPVGESVQIEWHGSWYPGRIVAVAGSRYKISYEGYASSWDEWVEPSRLRSR